MTESAKGWTFSELLRKQNEAAMAQPETAPEPVRIPDPSAEQTRPPGGPVALLDPPTRPERTRPRSEPVRRTDGFIQVTNHLLDDVLPGLDPADQVVLLRLYRLSRGHKNSTCRVSRQKLIAKTGVKKTRLLQSLVTLEERGYIRRLADDISNADVYARGMNIEMLLDGAEGVRQADGSGSRARPLGEPNKINTQKENTQTQEPAAGVRVGSKFSIEECRKYAEHLRSTGQGINNPGGYATTIHRTGEADELIERFLNPTNTTQVDASQCPDCKGSGFYYPNGPAGVQKVFTDSDKYFKDHSVLGTGQMLIDTLGNSETYKDLMKRIDNPKMKTAWEEMGKSVKSGADYQKASSALYIEGYRDGVTQMKPYLEDNPGRWAEDYFNWLSDTANLLTWQIQVASRQFDNVKTRMYEWYVKLQVLAPDKNYGERFMTIAYAALLGVNYSNSKWSDDLKPFLQAMIENAIAGKVDKSIMDQVQQQAAKENQELLKTLVSTLDTIVLLVDGIANALSAFGLSKTLQDLAEDTEAQRLIGQHLGGDQFQAWSEITAGGKAGRLLGMLFFGATAGFLIYTIADDAKKPQTPKQIVEEINIGILSMAILVKGIEKMMSLGVGRFLENFSKAGNGGAFRTFAGEFATWFKPGGVVAPTGKFGKAMVSIFGEKSTVFMARRIGPAMAVAGMVLSAFMLYDAIKSGDVRIIVFEALNAFFALAGVVLIGLELLSVGWAGPVGLAVAVVGVIVLLVQLIWSWISPQKPPPDPITLFVNGPMVEKHFARAV